MSIILKKIIEESNNIVFFGGAGTSTESGIPDFRSQGGIFSKIAPEMLSIWKLQEEPQAFFDFYREFMKGMESVKPNPAHYALAKLEEMGKLKAIITQNIDGLHQKAGSKVVYELHGTTERVYCTDCQQMHHPSFLLIGNDIPLCELCGCMIRPDVVLYGENLNEDIFAWATDTIYNAETLIVGGTSLVVEPAASLIENFRGKYRVLINKSETPYDSWFDLIVREPIGETLEYCIR